MGVGYLDRYKLLENLLHGRELLKVAVRHFVSAAFRRISLLR